MKESQILVVIKEPGQAPKVEPLFDNTLESFQKAVGGYIETVSFGSIVIICNEEGRLLGLEPNVEVGSVDFVGTILAVGVKEDEFCSLSASVVPKVLQILGGKDGASGSTGK